MIKQQSIRKSFVPRDSIVRANQGKASGDSTEDKHKNSSKSKSKVPKSVRYDLENALVGLCDVWFEDIKPYLMRNNVKMHIHHGEDVEADGDRRLPTGVLACSHLDPASSASSCELCRLLFNAANSIESAVSQAACASPPVPPPGSVPFNTGTGFQNPIIHNGISPEPNSHRRRRRRRGNNCHPLPPPPLVSRLCRTYSVLPDIPLENSTRNVRIQGKKTKRHVSPDARVQKLEMKNKMSQTENIPTSETTAGPKINNAYIKPLGRRQATTTLFSVNKEILNETRHTKMPPLFQDDLIDIIAEKNDKRLQILYESPRKVEYPSTMNLETPHKVILSASLQKKPWK